MVEVIRAYVHNLSFVNSGTMSFTAQKKKESSSSCLGNGTRGSGGGGGGGGGGRELGHVPPHNFCRSSETTNP